MLFKRNIKNKTLICTMILSLLVVSPIYSFGEEKREKVDILSGPSFYHKEMIGKDRYETSNKILKEMGEKNDTLIVVNASEIMSDGLSASALAGKLNANIVPINPKKLNNNIMAKVKKAEEVFLIGGYNAIPKTFESNLKNKKVIRIGGKDRVETSEKIANYVGDYKNAYIVNGYTGQADAMSISPVAARDVSPIILTKKSSSEVAKKDNVEYTIIGGEKAVSSKIQKRFSSKRIDGKDRYETNRNVLKKFYPNRKSISFCNGETLVDALSGTVYAKDEGIALVNRKNNLELLKCISTSQLGGLPFDVNFVYGCSGGSGESSGSGESGEVNPKPEEKPDSEEKPIEPENKPDPNEKSVTLLKGSDFSAGVANLLRKYDENKKGTYEIKFKYVSKDEFDKINGINLGELDENKECGVKGYAEKDINNIIVYVVSKGQMYTNENCGDMFNMYKLTNIEGLEKLNTSKTTNMSTMFWGTRIKELDLNSWDTSNVTDMHWMFKDSCNLTNLHIDKWDTSKVRRAPMMFWGCEKLEELDVSKWNLESLYSATGMFAGCESLKKLDVSNWNVSNVLYASSMFVGCKQLEELDVSNWNTSKFTEINHMFYECYKLKTLDLSKWDINYIEEIDHMFNECESLEYLDMSNWGTGKVKNFDYLFTGCKKLRRVDVSNWDTSNAKDMSYMFNGCESLEYIDIRTWDTIDTQDMSYMFNGCKNLEKIDSNELIGGDRYRFIKSYTGNMFSDCPKLSGRIRVSKKMWSYGDMFKNCSTENNAKFVIEYKGSGEKSVAEEIFEETKANSPKSNIFLEDLKNK